MLSVKRQTQTIWSAWYKCKKLLKYAHTKGLHIPTKSAYIAQLLFILSYLQQNIRKGVLPQIISVGTDLNLHVWSHWLSTQHSFNTFTWLRGCPCTGWSHAHLRYDNDLYSIAHWQFAVSAVCCIRRMDRLGRFFVFFYQKEQLSWLLGRFSVHRSPVKKDLA